MSTLFFMAFISSPHKLIQIPNLDNSIPALPDYLGLS
jgi:hypothetical protein